MVVVIGIFAKHYKRIFPALEMYHVELAYFVIFVGFYVCVWHFYRKLGIIYMENLFAKLLIAVIILCIFIGTTIQVAIPPRAKFGAVCICIVCFFLIYRTMIYHMLPSIWQNRSNKIIIVFSVCYSIFVLSAYIDGRVKWNKMVNSINEQKARGVEEVIVDSRTFKSFYNKYGDWSNPGENTDEWPNTSYAKYFGVKKFIVR